MITVYHKFAINHNGFSCVYLIILAFLRSVDMKPDIEQSYLHVFCNKCVVLWAYYKRVIFLDISENTQKRYFVMLLLSRIMLANMILAVLVQCVDGNQRIVCVSELISDEEDVSVGASGEGEMSGLYENSSCSPLGHALANLTSNVLINITTDVTLSSILKVSDLQNVSIIGHNNPTVNCKTGGIHFNLCHNCIIQGIIWNGCGSETKAGAALMLNNSSQITIRNCSFQHSSGQVIVLSEVSAEININYCNFSKNNQYKGHGTSIHAVAAGSSNFTLNMNNCNFNYNTYAKSLVYIRSIEHNAITLYDSTFNSNIGVSIFLINQVLLLKGNVLFQSNRAENGAAIYISNHSRVIFGEDSDVAFIQNSADNAGGAIFLNNHSSLLFI